MSGSHFRCAVSADSANQIANLLQPLVFDLSDLALLCKQMHWNVRGVLFKSVHEQLDELNDALRDAADDIAERIITLGHPVDGSSQSIARSSRLNPIRVNFLPVQEVIGDASNRLLSVIESLRVSIDSTGSLDPVTQDLLIGIAGDLEKKLWMLQVQQL